MRTLAVLAVLFAAPIWADRAPDPADEGVSRGGGRGRPHCVSKGGSCGAQSCCPGLVCDFNMCAEKDALTDDEVARKKAQAERRDEPSPR
ncbi:MAG: hypothetical protein QM723_11280 [Myxococcaceae bacterium]